MGMDSHRPSSLFFPTSPIRPTEHLFFVEMGAILFQAYLIELLDVYAFGILVDLIGL